MFLSSCWKCPEYTVLLWIGFLKNFIETIPSCWSKSFLVKLLVCCCNSFTDSNYYILKIWENLFRKLWLIIEIYLHHLAAFLSKEFKKQLRILLFYISFYYFKSREDVFHSRIKHLYGKHHHAFAGILSWTSRIYI